MSGCALVLREKHPSLPVYLKALELHGNQTEAARIANVDPRTARRWGHDDPEIAARIDAACQVAWDRLEAEAYRRANDGWDEPVFYEGEVVGSRRVYSDRLLELMLKAKRGREFRDPALIDARRTTNVLAVGAGGESAEAVRREAYLSIGGSAETREAALVLLQHLAGAAALPAPAPVPTAAPIIVDVKPETNGHAMDGEWCGPIAPPQEKTDGVA